MTIQSHSFLTEGDRAAIADIGKRATVREIARQVCEETGHSYAAVMGKSRLAADCRVRELVCYIANRNGVPLAQIGRILRRDHTTIMHAVRNEKARRGEA